MRAKGAPVSLTMDSNFSTATPKYVEYTSGEAGGQRPIQEDETTMLEGQS